jgi:triphosphatase
MSLHRDTETELKFEITESALARLREQPALFGSTESSRLRSVYFDTPDQALRGARFSLRVRESHGRFIQTVKACADAGMIERHEWETEIAAENPDLAALARTPAATVLDGRTAKALTAVFSTTVVRTVHLWRDGATVIELSVDEGEISAGDGREPIREVELELKSGEPAALFGLARELAKAAPLRLSLDSKAVRGYRLAGQEVISAMKAELPSLKPETLVAEALCRTVNSCLGQIVGNAELFSRARNPEALHQTRIGLRRLRANLSAFHSLVGDDRFEKLTSDAQWLASALDRARDLDVFAGTTTRPDEERTHANPALAMFRKRLLAAHAKAYGNAVAAIEAPRFSNFVLNLAEWVEAGSWRDDPALETLRRKQIAAFAAEAFDRLHQRVLKRGRGLARMVPESRHRLRIAGKKLRYAAELFGEAFPEHPKRHRAYVNALEDLQDRLGKLNDLTVERTLAFEIALPTTGAIAFAAGLMVGSRQQAEPALLAAAIKAFRRFVRARPFWSPDNN